MENVWKAPGKGQQSILGCEHVFEPSWEMHTSIHPELHTSREVGEALGIVASLPDSVYRVESLMTFEGRRQ